MSFLYSCLLLLFVFFYFPLFLFEYFKKGKYKGFLKKKLGFEKYSFQSNKPTLWVHAVSVGEVKAVSSLVQRLKELYPNSTLILSCVTQTGHLEAKKSSPQADYHVLMPLDFKGRVKKLLSSLNRLDLLLLVETDLWPHFVSACRKKGARIGIINAKISNRSFLRLKKIPLFTRWYYSSIDFMLIQDQVYKQRFIELGLGNKQLEVVPNIKLDDTYLLLQDDEKKHLKKRFGIHEVCITLGSTHPGEEELLLKAIAPLLKENPHYKVLLVPRHPERNDAVELFLKTLPFRYGRYSTTENLEESQIILIDVMGFLRTCYQLSDVAVVAGSFVKKIGGHNILEPLWYGVPSLFGPYMHSQSQFVHLVQQADAAEQVEVQNLVKSLQKLLHQPLYRKQMGERGQRIFKEASGGTELTLRFIQKTLELNVASL